MRKFRYLGRQKMLDQNFSQFEQFLEQILKVRFFLFCHTKSLSVGWELKYKTKKLRGLKKRRNAS